MINFGVFSDRLGLDPNAAGVLRIYKGGRFIVDDNVRNARDCKIYVAGELSIGSNTFKIGSNSMIASGSIVTKDVPENSLFGGVPAKCLKSDIAWK